MFNLISLSLSNTIISTDAGSPVAANAPALVDHSERVIHTANGLWSTASGYGVIDIAKSLGVMDTGDLPVNGQNNNLALNAVNAPSAWAAGFTGKGVTVAVIDSGIAHHAEIADRIVGGYDFYDKDETPLPDSGVTLDHGLSVGAIIAASHSVHAGPDTMGVAPDASLLNVRVAGDTGGNTVNVAAGIRWAVDHGAKVICIPLQNKLTTVDQFVFDAVHYAFQNNVVTVVIGGNFSNYGPTGLAAVVKQLNGEALAVGNYDLSTTTAFASSNMPGSDPFPWVMASSTGVLPKASGAYASFVDGGTSYAGPYVAGLAALLWQQDPAASASSIMAKIVSGATLAQTVAVTLALPPPVIGSAGADLLTLVHGATIDGGGGIDTLRFPGARADYTIIGSAAGFIVTTTASNSDNVLFGVERLAFSDQSIALDVVGNGGAAYRLYQAAFDRVPDKAGLGFWMSAMDRGQLLADVADGFVRSAEFQQLYGASPDNAQLVTAMYRNVLHRAPDAGGMDFWLGAMDGGRTAVDLLTSFSESAENQAAAIKLIGLGFEFTSAMG